MIDGCEVERRSGGEGEGRGRGVGGVEGRGDM